MRILLLQKIAKNHESFINIHATTKSARSVPSTIKPGIPNLYKRHGEKLVLLYKCPGA